MCDPAAVCTSPDPAIGSTPRADRSAAGVSATPLNLSALSWLSRSEASAAGSGALSTSASWEYRDGSLSQAASPQSPARDPLWAHRAAPYTQVGRATGCELFFFRCRFWFL